MSTKSLEEQLDEIPAAADNAKSWDAVLPARLKRSPNSEVAACGCSINAMTGDRANCQFGRVALDAEDQVHELIDHIDAKIAHAYGSYIEVSQADPLYMTRQALLQAVEGLQQAYRLHVRSNIVVNHP